jgi:hypothetical protein
MKGKHFTHYPSGPAGDAPSDRVGFRKLPGHQEKVCVICSRTDGAPVRKSRTVLYATNVGNDCMNYKFLTTAVTLDRELQDSVCVCVLYI